MKPFGTPPEFSDKQVGVVAYALLRMYDYPDDFSPTEDAIDFLRMLKAAGWKLYKDI